MNIANAETPLPEAWVIICTPCGHVTSVDKDATACPKCGRAVEPEPAQLVGREATQLIVDDPECE